MGLSRRRRRFGRYAYIHMFTVYVQSMFNLCSVYGQCEGFALTLTSVGADMAARRHGEEEGP